MSIAISAGALVASSAFASGYGPAPYYNGADGAPASQRGISMQTIAAEQGSAGSADEASMAKVSQPSQTAEVQQ
jgi:hypothetical protein